MANPSSRGFTTVESPAGMDVFAGQAKPVAPSFARASQPIRSPADSEPPAAHSCSRMTSATAGRSGRSATRGFPEIRRPDSTIPNDVWDRNDHRWPERVADAAVRSFLRIIGSPRKTALPTISASGKSPCLSGYTGSGPLQPPATVCQHPARMRLPALGHAFGCLRNACCDLRYLNGRTVRVGTHGCHLWMVRRRVRRRVRRFHRTVPTYGMAKLTCRSPDCIPSARRPRTRVCNAPNRRLPQNKKQVQTDVPVSVPHSD